ncbi:hypothetical protein QUB19_07105 [Microcoleus sp. B4-C5]
MAASIDFGGLNFDFGRRRSLFHQLRRDRTHSPKSNSLETFLHLSLN